MTKITADLSAARLSTLVAVYCEMADAPIKKFSDKETAVRRVSALAAASGMDLVFHDGDLRWKPLASTLETLRPDEDTQKPVVAATASPKKRGPAPKHADDATVRVLVTENPKRVGSASAARFALWASSATVGDYLGACAALQGGTPADYRSDTVWDSDKGFVSFG